MISIRQGHYQFEDYKLRMNFDLQHGVLAAVLGPSGAGKSTLLNILAGFETLAKGSLEIDGRPMAKVDPAQFPVNMVFQDNNSFAHLDAWRNVALGISPRLRLTEAEHARVDQALARVSLAHLAKRKPGEMSGGERQRIALARVLVRDKPILLLDEPFAALGPALRVEMLDLLRQLHKEKNLTTLMVTHSADDAKHVADQVIFVDAGQVRAPVPTPKFFLSKDDPRIKAYLG